MTTILGPGNYTVAPVPPPVTITKTILPALQNAPFELLWGVGRSHPVNNPPTHGTATWTPGEPAILDYHPVPLPADRDNLYCLRRLGQYLPDFSGATQFTESEVYTVSSLTAPEALEVDWHMQPVGAKVYNPGLQLLPGSPSWTVRLWNQFRGDWEPSGATFDGNALLTGLAFGGEYAITPSGLTYLAVTVGGVRFPQSLTVPPIAVAPVTKQVFNKAVQTDANGQAAPYTLRIGKMTVTYA